jgi:phosphoesterase RecJ-like protein
MRTSSRENAGVPEAILRALDAPGPFLITGHVRPDGDFLGTALALALWLRARGEGATVVSCEGVPEPYGFLPGADTVSTEFPHDPGARIAIIVDTPLPERTGAPPGYFEGGRGLINIDHHPDNPGFGDATFVDPSASSSAVLAFEILQAAAAPIDAAIASALYVGIMTDTGGFRFTNTDATALRAAGELVVLGARPAELAREVYGSLSAQELRLLGRVLSSVQSALDGRVSILCVTDDMRSEARTGEDGIEGLASYGRDVEGTEVAVLLRETGGTVRASLRSAGDVDVGAVARELGGGGHRAAAGVVLDGPVADARERVVSAIARRVGRGG